jgi:hypothetical protein
VIGVEDRKQLFLTVRDAFPKASKELQVQLEKAVLSGHEFAEVIPAGPQGSEMLVVATSASSASDHSKATIRVGEQAPTSTSAKDDLRVPGASVEPAQPLQVSLMPPFAATGLSALKHSSPPGTVTTEMTRHRQTWKTGHGGMVTLAKCDSLVHRMFTSGDQNCS